MNILITGASGFIGTALAKYLADKHTVICLSRQAPEGALRMFRVLLIRRRI